MTPQEKLAQQIQVLEALADADKELKRIDGLLTEENTLLEGLAREQAYLDGKITADRASLEEMQKTVSELTIEAKQMGLQIDRSREKGGRARNERENIAAEREQEELRKLLRDREEEIGKLNGLIESARKSIASFEAQRDKIRGELTTGESSSTQRLGGARGEREQKIAQRSDLAKKLPPAVLRRYEAVLRKRGSAIAKVIDGTCRACFVSLPPQFFHKLMRREELEECPNCYRIIYWAPAPASPKGAP
jgi:hypothetical protein